MTDFAKGFLMTLGLVALLGCVGLAGYQGYRWKLNVNERGWLSENSASYLFGPSGVKDKDGKPVRRADLIDALLAQALKEK